MGQSTSQQRINWQQFGCREETLSRIHFAGDELLVAPGTEDAWKALETVLAAHDYKVRPSATSSYCCRAITDGTEKSLHAYGIAIDVNANTNPFRRTPDKRP